MDFSVHGILQARILEWIAFPSPGDLPDPGIEPGSPTFPADALTSEPLGNPEPPTFNPHANGLAITAPRLRHYAFISRTRSVCAVCAVTRQSTSRAISIGFTAFHSSSRSSQLVLLTSAKTNSSTVTKELCVGRSTGM